MTSGHDHGQGSQLIIVAAHIESNDLDNGLVFLNTEIPNWINIGSHLLAPWNPAN